MGYNIFMSNQNSQSALDFQLLEVPRSPDEVEPFVYQSLAYGRRFVYQLADKYPELFNWATIYLDRMRYCIGHPVPTMAVDKDWRLYVSTDSSVMINKIYPYPARLAFVLIHEMLHVAMRHAERGEVVINSLC